MHKRICQKVDAIAPFTLGEKECIKRLTRYAIEKCTEASRFYWKFGADLADRADKAGANWAFISGWERGILALVAIYEMEAAWKLYREMIVWLVNTYWPDCTEKVYLDGLVLRDQSNASQRQRYIEGH